MTNLEADAVTIQARSKRQAMDWSLVLASQDIPTLIDHSEENGWGLVVCTHDHDRALSAIRQYRLENRRWAWRQSLPGSDVTLHWGGLIWCALLALIYQLSAKESLFQPSVAGFNSQAVWKGEWWRAFTAILLHADLGHLFTNVATGVVLFGLAMARYGAGSGLLAAYLAGAVGNLAGLLLYARPYQGLGASGMVLGALGLIAVPPFAAWPPLAGKVKQLARGTVAGLLLFVILGTNPASDVVAHAGGFGAGVVGGVLLNLLSPETLQRPGFIRGSWTLFGALLIVTHWLAFARL